VEFFSRVVGLSQGFSIFPHEHLLLVIDFSKPLIDLLLTSNCEKRLKFEKITEINNFLARLYQLATQRSTFALISGQPAWFASGDCDNEGTCC